MWHPLRVFVELSQRVTHEQVQSTVRFRYWFHIGGVLLGVACVALLNAVERQPPVFPQLNVQLSVTHVHRPHLLLQTVNQSDYRVSSGKWHIKWR